MWQSNHYPSRDYHFAEAVGEFGSQIISWDLEQNIAQDSVMAMTFLEEAASLIEGIKEYCDTLGIENPNDMGKSQAKLQEKMEQVKKAILHEYKKGESVHCFNNVDPLHSSPDTAGNFHEASSERQVSLDDILVDLGIVVPVDKQNDSDAVTTTSTAEASIEANIENTVEEHNATSREKTLTEAVIDGTENSVADESNTDNDGLSCDTDDTDDTDDEVEPEPSSSTEKGASGKDSSVDDSASTDTDNETEHKLIIENDKCFIDGIEIGEYCNKYDFSTLPDNLRRQALLYLLRCQQNFELKDLGDRKTMTVDGAYFASSLEKKAAETGFVLLPTDLMGSKSNPVIGLFSFDDEMKKVLHCPKNGQIEEQYFNNNGQIVIKMNHDACEKCPFHNDCKAEWQPRLGVWKVVVTPNSYSRVHTEAFLRDEMYNCVGRFRNGVETIPNLLHNVFHVDDMPIGQAAKEFTLLLKITALNIRKFGLFCIGRTSIRSNPLFSRCFA